MADFKKARKAKSYPDTAAGEDERGNDSQRERQLTSDFETCAGEIMAKEVKNICALQASPIDAYYAFTEKTYSSFLDRLAVPEKCWDRKHQVKFRKKPELGIFPGYINNDIKRPAPTTAKKMSDHIQQLVDKKIPVLLSFCLDGTLPPASENCKNGHAVVISGSRQVCKGSDCKISFRVQSSWGQSWQDQNDDGWVDGEELIRRTSLDPLSLLYLEPKK